MSNLRFGLQFASPPLKSKSAMEVSNGITFSQVLEVVLHAGVPGQTLGFPGRRRGSRTDVMFPGKRHVPGQTSGFPGKHRGSQANVGVSGQTSGPRSDLGSPGNAGYLS